MAKRGVRVVIEGVRPRFKGRRRAGGHKPAGRRRDLPLSEAFVGFADLPDHQIVAAQRRLEYLRRFWAAERAAGYRRRWTVAQRVIEAIKRKEPDAAVSLSSLQRWEMLWRSEGLAGLVGGPIGRPRKQTGV